MERIKKLKRKLKKKPGKDLIMITSVATIGILVPIVIQCNLWGVSTLIMKGIKIGSGQDWLQFWGGYLGSIIAICGVYWQVNRTLKGEKEASFRKERPFFNITYNYGKLKKDEGYIVHSLPFLSQQIKAYLNCAKKRFDTITIDNISEKNMYEVQIVFKPINKGKVNDSKTFKVKSIEKKEKINILVNDLNELSEADNIVDDDWLYRNNYELNIGVYFTTEIREKVKLVFRLVKEKEPIYKIEYLPSKKKLENKGDTIDPEEYYNSGFESDHVYYVENK